MAQSTRHANTPALSKKRTTEVAKWLLLWGVVAFGEYVDFRADANLNVSTSAWLTVMVMLALIVASKQLSVFGDKAKSAERNTALQVVAWLALFGGEFFVISSEMKQSMGQDFAHWTHAQFVTFALVMVLLVMAGKRYMENKTEDAIAVELEYLITNADKTASKREVVAWLMIWTAVGYGSYVSLASDLSYSKDTEIMLTLIMVMALMVIFKQLDVFGRKGEAIHNNSQVRAAAWLVIAACEFEMMSSDLPQAFDGLSDWQSWQVSAMVLTVMLVLLLTKYTLDHADDNDATSETDSSLGGYGYEVDRGR